MFLVSLVTTVAALIVIVVAVVVAETALVYIAIGLAGVGAVLLTAEAVRQREALGIPALLARRGKSTSTGWDPRTDGLGKAPVPVTPAAGAIPDAHSGEGVRVPASAESPVRGAAGSGWNTAPAESVVGNGGPEPPHFGAVGGDDTGDDRGDRLDQGSNDAATDTGTDTGADTDTSASADTVVAAEEPADGGSALPEDVETVTSVESDEAAVEDTLKDVTPATATPADSDEQPDGPPGDDPVVPVEAVDTDTQGSSATQDRAEPVETAPVTGVEPAEDAVIADEAGGAEVDDSEDAASDDVTTDAPLDHADADKSTPDNSPGEDEPPPDEEAPAEGALFSSFVERLREGDPKTDHEPASGLVWEAADDTDEPVADTADSESAGDEAEDGDGAPDDAPGDAAEPSEPPPQEASFDGADGVDDIPAEENNADDASVEPDEAQPEEETSPIGPHAERATDTTSE